MPLSFPICVFVDTLGTLRLTASVKGDVMLRQQATTQQAGRVIGTGSVAYCVEMASMGSSPAR